MELGGEELKIETDNQSGSDSGSETPASQKNPLTNVLTSPSKAQGMQQAFLKMLNSRIVEDRTFMARVSEEAQMFDDMIIYIKELLGAKSEDFTVEERNLINVAFKNWIELERKSIKLVGDLSENPKLAKYRDNMKAYQKKLEQELDDKSNAIISII